VGQHNLSADFSRPTTETRIVKIVMVGSLALLAGLVTFDNLIDYENEFGEQGLVDIASDANRMHMRRIVERLIVSEQSAVAAK
jgi:predicted small integral membrane protein